MVSLIMLVIIAGCAAALYLKGNLVQGITLVLNALIAGLVAFAFYETLGGLLSKYAAGIAGWSQMICFLLVFILLLAILQTVVMQLGKEKMDLGLWPERVGRIVSGIFLGYVITGYLLTALALAPLPSSIPYARFEQRNPDASQANKPMFSPDGFVSGLFGTISKGSFAALGTPRSFAVLHADFLNRLYLNRHKISQDIPLQTSTPALSIPSKAGVWEAPATLRDTNGQALPARPGETLMLVRVGIKKSAIKDAGQFSLSQLHLICVPKANSDAPLAGAAEVAYPIGYVGSGGQLEQKSLSDLVTLKSGQIQGKALDIDFAFYVPAGLTPALISFKGNNLEKLSKPVSGEDAPRPLPFGQTAPPADDAPAPDAADEQPRREPPPSSRQNRRRGSGLSPAGQALTGGALEEN